MNEKFKQEFIKSILDENHLELINKIIKIIKTKITNKYDIKILSYEEMGNKEIENEILKDIKSDNHVIYIQLALETILNLSEDEIIKYPELIILQIENYFNYCKCNHGEDDYYKYKDEYFSEKQTNSNEDSIEYKIHQYEKGVIFIAY